MSQKVKDQNYHGNDFHCKVVNLFREKSWDVIVSPYYCDNLSDKPREIDIIAKKSFPVKNNYDQLSGNVDLVLFIECKYLNGSATAWFDEIDLEKRAKKIERQTGIPLNNIQIMGNHFMETNEVAKLFEAEKDRCNKDIFYDAINQSLNATIYFRERTKGFLEQHTITQSLKTICYPVIIFNSFEKISYRNFKLTEADIPGNFVAELNYSYQNSSKKSVDEYFLIDVVSFEMIEDYLAVVEKDIITVCNYQSETINFPS